MILDKIIRSPRGTDRHEVLLQDIKLPEVLTIPLVQKSYHWQDVLHHYYVDVRTLLTAIRGDLALPKELFIPDLWHLAIELAAVDRDKVIDLWTLGYDMAEAARYVRVETVKMRGIVGVIFRRDRLVVNNDTY